MLGNSVHSVASMQALYTLARSHRPPPLYAYLHEPYLNGLLAPLVGPSRFLSALRRSYPERPFPDDAAAFREAPRLVGGRILGARALLESVHLEGIFVNSQFALELLRADYPEFPASGIKRALPPGIHTCRYACASGRRTAAAHRLLRRAEPVSRSSDVLLDAFRRLRSRDPQTELILSGYGMAAFAEERGLAQEPGLRVHESPSGEVFEALMASVDVAVAATQCYVWRESGHRPATGRARPSDYRRAHRCVRGIRGRRLLRSGRRYARGARGSQSWQRRSSSSGDELPWRPMPRRTIGKAARPAAPRAFRALMKMGGQSTGPRRRA